jgi:hypothetical protein
MIQIFRLKLFFLFRIVSVFALLIILISSCGKSDPHPSGLIPENTGLTGVVVPEKFVEANFGTLVSKFSELSGKMAFPNVGIHPLKSTYFFSEGNGMLRTRLGLIAELQSKSDLERFLKDNATKIEQGDVSMAKLGNHTWVAFTDETVFFLYSFSGENLHDDLKSRMENWLKINQDAISTRNDSICFSDHQLSVHYNSDYLKNQIGFLLESQGFFFLSNMKEGTHGRILIDAVNDSIHTIVQNSNNEEKKWQSAYKYFEKVAKLDDEKISYAGNVLGGSTIDYLKSQPWWQLYAKRYWLDTEYAQSIAENWNGQWYFSKGEMQQVEVTTAEPIFDEATGEYNLGDKTEVFQTPSFLLQLGSSNAKELMGELKEKFSAIGYKDHDNGVIEISAEPLLGIGNFPKLLANGLKIFAEENVLYISSGDVTDEELLSEHSINASDFIWLMKGEPQAYQSFATAPELNLLLGSLEKSFKEIQIQNTVDGKEICLVTKNQENAGLVLFELLNQFKGRYWK